MRSRSGSATPPRVALFGLVYTPGGAAGDCGHPSTVQPGATLVRPRWGRGRPLRGETIDTFLAELLCGPVIARHTQELFPKKNPMLLIQIKPVRCIIG